MVHIRGTMFSLICKIFGGLYGGLYGRERVSDYTFSLPSLSLFSAQVPPPPSLFYALVPPPPPIFYAYLSN